MTVTAEEKSFISHALGSAPCQQKTEIAPLTVAQSIRRSCDPYRACINSFIRREIIRSEDGHSDKKIFHFEDGSFLTFLVSYTAIEDGSIL